MNQLDLLLAVMWAVNGFTFAWSYTRGRTIAARHYVAAGAIVIAVCTVLAALVLDAPRLYWKALPSAAPIIVGAWAGLTVGRYVPPPAPYEASATPGSMWWVVPFGLLLGASVVAPMLIPFEFGFAYAVALAPLLVLGHVLVVRRHRRVVDEKRREPVLRIDA